MSEKIKAKAKADRIADRKEAKRVEERKASKIETKKDKVSKPEEGKKIGPKDLKVKKDLKVVQKADSKSLKLDAKASKSDVKASKAESKPVKAEVKKDSADVKAAKVLSSKFENALSSVKVTATKIKYGEGNVTVFTNDRLSPKQFSKLKSIAGKKLDLSTRGESWVLAYA